MAEDCVESLKRWGKRDHFGQLLMAHTVKIMPVDNKSFTVDLAERFGSELDALGSHRPAFKMPARIATPDDKQIEEIIGSVPFKFARDEWEPGEQVVYLRTAEYVPRDETRSGLTGGRRAHLDKIRWRYFPDP